MQTYEVAYRYYQYNSGAADNGEYTRRIEAKSAEDATDLAARINASAANKGPNEEGEYLLKRELIPFDGYFICAGAYRVTREPIPSQVPVPGK